MTLNFPCRFITSYPQDNKRYYTQDSAAREEISRRLLEASDLYCMYCGKNLYVDEKLSFNIEHSVEKGLHSEESTFLAHCKFNLSVTCSECNQRYKTRMIEMIPIDNIDLEGKCLKNSCSKPCEEYIKIRNEYLEKNNIILQPFGVINNDTGNIYQIQYNLIKHIFEYAQPCKNVSGNESTYNSKEISFIREHIARFHLNRERFTKVITKICENVYRTIRNLEKMGSIQGIPVDIIYEEVKQERYDNILGKIFIEYLMENVKDTEELFRVCRLLLVLDFI